jgi:hypothetical protein
LSWPPYYDEPVNDSTVLLAANLAWPVVVLVIAALLLASQRKPVGRLIDRVKSLKYPGGEAQLGVAVPEAGADTILALVDVLSRDLSERTERDEPAVATAGVAAGEAIQNREPLAGFEPLPVEEVTNLVMLRTKVANLLSELAVPPPPGGFGPISATIDILSGRGVLDVEQAQALRDAVDIADQAARGAMVPRRVAVAVENSGPAILEQLALLRTVAAARFEDYVLDALQQRLPADWSVDIDRTIVSDEQLDAVALSGRNVAGRHARVDALVTAGDQSAVVEVRARLQPGAAGQIEAVRTWMMALPADLPVLLVMLGDALSPRELRQISNGHQRPVELLSWDKYSASLIMVLRDLLTGPRMPLPDAGLVPGSRPAP